MIVIRAVKFEGVAAMAGDVDGQWLEFFDPEAHNGYGEALFTNDIAKAMKFKDIEEAFAFWKTQSHTRPLRPDGKPNRPLTAFTITFDEVEG